jgi:hypothetical protein
MHAGGADAYAPVVYQYVTTWFDAEYATYPAPCLFALEWRRTTIDG